MMWRKLLTSSSSHAQLVRSSIKSNNATTNLTINRLLITSSSSSSSSTNVSNPFQKTTPLFSQQTATASVGKLRVEDVMPIATGHEKEELEASLQGRDLLEMNHPAGPFGTKESPAIVHSVYDKRIVGCPGGEGEDEHDVVWFWLEKGKTHECPVCTQHFKLEVVGPGGPPDGHGDDHH